MLRGVLKELANGPRDRGAIDEPESFIDAAFDRATGGGAEIGNSRHGKRVKIMAIVDLHGLPLSVSPCAASHHEVTLVQLSFDFYLTEAKPENLIGDNVYDSDELDKSLNAQGVEMIVPHRSNRKLKSSRTPVSPVSTPFAGGTFLRAATVEAPPSDPLGTLRSKLPRIRRTHLHHNATQTILS